MENYDSYIDLLNPTIPPSISIYQSPIFNVPIVDVSTTPATETTPNVLISGNDLTATTTTQDNGLSRNIMFFVGACVLAYIVF